ncbi:hypothetical protein SAMN05518801_105229 [Novosphingobium sp. CF614]|uniref:tetratricopeptide repeat protein n=1 Tax=Novosphingobium sp. CF614 TaxID=1884364 RepID=UPI0008DF6B3E|nr:hypothetical protein [Novosphingobium sp. CF614]SFG02009.1 hypothetical protein SAMN05518801_105229 [Novosphingobium sp. CF614]
MISDDFSIASSVVRGKQIIDIVTGLLTIIDNDEAANAKALAAGKIHEIGREFEQARKAYAAAQGLPEAAVRSAIVDLKTGEACRALGSIKHFIEAHRDFRFADISGRPLSAATILGDAYRMTGNGKAAIDAYREALELVPGDSHSAAHLARLYLTDNAPEEAITLSERFLDAEEMSALQSTTRLLANDPNKLPALGGLVSSMTRKFSDVR